MDDGTVEVRAREREGVTMLKFVVPTVCDLVQNLMKIQYIFKELHAVVRGGSFHA
jgi:hypothetical protein